MCCSMPLFLLLLYTGPQERTRERERERERFYVAKNSRWQQSYAYFYQTFYVATKNIIQHKSIWFDLNRNHVTIKCKQIESMRGCGSWDSFVRLLKFTERERDYYQFVFVKFFFSFILILLLVLYICNAFLFLCKRKKKRHYDYDCS